MLRRSAALLIGLMLFLLCLLSFASAESNPEIIRVGWYAAPFNQKDSFGRRTGYAYEYQRKIAAYTGWKYEYVEGTWSELLQMLMDGRIDLMSDVSFTAERAEHLLYSDLPMGLELYFLYIAPGNRDISVEDSASLNGKKVGVTRNTVQKGLFLHWLEESGITVNLLEQDCTEEESIELLNEGELDAFVTLEAYGNPEKAVPVWKIGSSDFYFAVSKTRPDLLAMLNTALNRIQDENKNYSEELSAKYLTGSETNRYLTADEKKWLEGHGPIRVGYQDNYLAFCASDPKTGELTGALKDYLELASDSLENARPEFEAIAFPTAAAALEALTSGGIDCMFPANLTDYDGEIAGVVMTAPLMVTEMDAIVRAEDRQDILRRSQVRVGVNRGNPNYELFLREHFPGWTPVLFADTPSCLDAVGEKNADCVIVSNYRFNDIAAQCRRLNLAAVYTGVDMNYCFAVREGNTMLYSVLSRMIRRVPESSVNAALSYYSAAGKSESSGQMPMVLFLIIPAVIIILLLFVVLTQSRRLRALKKSPEKAPGPAEKS